MSEQAYYVYALLDPLTGQPFYIGCSVNPTKRLKTHGRDQASAAYDRVRALYAVGKQPILALLGVHHSKIAALAEEDWLIRATPDLENLSDHPRGCACGKRHGRYNGMYDEMTINDVIEWVDRVAENADDFEMARAIEDDIHDAVLKSIAEGTCPDPKRFAEAAMRSATIEFPRYPD